MVAFISCNWPQLFNSRRSGNNRHLVIYLPASLSLVAVLPWFPLPSAPIKKKSIKCEHFCDKHILWQPAYSEVSPSNTTLSQLISEQAETYYSWSWHLAQYHYVLVREWEDLFAMKYQTRNLSSELNISMNVPQILLKLYYTLICLGGTINLKAQILHTFSTINVGYLRYSTLKTVDDITECLYSLYLKFHNFGISTS